jgi:hypothetical protein
MKWGHGVKEYILTRGGLMNKLSTLSNPFSDEWLNHQKSAEAIVLEYSRIQGRAEQMKKNKN